MSTRNVDFGLPSPARVLEMIYDLVARRQSDLVVVWVQWSGDRSELSRGLCARSSDVAVVPVVIREAVFDNPNTVMADFVRTLLTHEAEIKDLFPLTSMFPGSWLWR